MTPEQRLDRVERILTLFVRAGRRTRSEWRLRTREHDQRMREQDEKINILIQTQIETTEQIKGLTAAQAELNKSQKLTDQALRAFINSLRKGQNGKSSN